MIRVDCQQGSEEWRAARAGIVTASALEHLITKKTLEPSKQSRGYLCRLVAEAILGEPIEDGSSAFTERGKELEPEAVRWYEWEKGLDTEAVGFLLRDDRRVGCSPDRLVGEDGGLEVKVPSAHVHVGYLLDPDSLVLEYRHQVQGGLLVTGRKWWDVLSYNPDLPPVMRRVFPDVDYLAALESALATFLAQLDEAKAKVRALIEKRDEAFVARREEPVTTSPIQEALAAAIAAGASGREPMTDDERADFDDSVNHLFGEE